MPLSTTSPRFSKNSRDKVFGVVKKGLWERAHQTNVSLGVTAALQATSFDDRGLGIPWHNANVFLQLSAHCARCVCATQFPLFPPCCKPLQQARVARAIWMFSTSKPIICLWRAGEMVGGQGQAITAGVQKLSSQRPSVQELSWAVCRPEISVHLSGKERRSHSRLICHQECKIQSQLAQQKD